MIYSHVCVCNDATSMFTSAVLQSALNSPSPPSKYKTPVRRKKRRSKPALKPRDVNVIPSKTPKKRQRSDVEMAVYMAASGLKTSPECEEELHLSRSQYNKRIKFLKQGPHRVVEVTVRCGTCCRFLHRFTDVVLPLGDKCCDCGDHCS